GMRTAIAREEQDASGGNAGRDVPLMVRSRARALVDGAHSPFNPVRARWFITGLHQVALWGMCVWAGLWIVWAFLARGGLSYLMSGIALVRADGRPALRLQCAWRAVVVWVPVAGLAYLSYWLETYGWSMPPARAATFLLLSKLTWYAAAALLALDLALALWRPARSVNDWLAGTYLVPR